jgi:hypothetical protein
METQALPGLAAARRNAITVMIGEQTSRSVETTVQREFHHWPFLAIQCP